MTSGHGRILSLETNLTQSCERNWANTTGGPANPEPHGRNLGWEEECPVALRFRTSWIISSLSPSGSHGKSGPSVIHCRPLSPHFQVKFWGSTSSGFHCPCQEPEQRKRITLPPLPTHLLHAAALPEPQEPTPATGAVSPPPGPHVELSFTLEAKRAGDGVLSWARGPPSQLRSPRPLLQHGQGPSFQETAEAEVLGTLLSTLCTQDPFLPDQALALSSRNLLE